MSRCRALAGLPDGLRQRLAHGLGQAWKRRGRAAPWVMASMMALTMAGGIAQAAEESPPLVSEAERVALGKEGLPPQASIVFPDRNIDSWRANGRKGLWIRAQRKWYYAELFMECPDLPWAESVGFVAGGPGSFDRYSYILVRGERYPLRSLTASSEPPREERKRGKKTPATAPAAPATTAPVTATPAPVPAPVPVPAPATPVKPESSR